MKILNLIGAEILYEFDVIPAVSVSFQNTEKNKLIIKEYELNISYENPASIASQTPNWGYDLIEANKIHSSNITGEGIDVAIIDTGVDQTHTDLSIAGGKSFVSYTPSYRDDNGHGTHVAGIISAKDNEIGVVGVAPNVNLYALKAFDSDGNGTTLDLAEAIDWAINQKVDIINMSFEFAENDIVVEALLKKAYNNGILIVGAAGNDGGSEVKYPAKYSSVIAVGSVDKTLKKSSFSNTGSDLEIVSPGVNIYSTWTNNNYSYSSGTSMSAAFVSGYLALMKEKYPEKTASELRTFMQKSAIDLGTPGKDAFYGFGLIKNFIPPLKNSEYVRIIKESPPIYIKKGETLIKVGNLKKDQTFLIDGIKGNWIELNIGENKSYVYKDNIQFINKPTNIEFSTSFNHSGAFIEPLSNVNIYDNSTEKLIPIGLLLHGESYEVLKDYGNWLSIRFAGREGFVYKANVNVIGASTQVYKTIRTTPIYQKINGVLIKQATLKENQSFLSFHSVGNWHEINFGGAAAYIYKNNTKSSYDPNLNSIADSELRETLLTNGKTYVYEKLINGSLKPFITLEKGAKLRKLEDFGDWLSISIGGKEGFIYKSNVTFEFSPNDSYYTIYSTYANIYHKDKNGRMLKMGSLEKGHTFKRIGQVGNWHKIQLDNSYGYVYLNGTMPTKNRITSTEYFQGKLTFTTKYQANVYDNSTGSLVLIGRINKGETYNAISKNGNWLKISLSGRIAYLHENGIM